MASEYAVAKAQEKARITRASQILIGIVTGMVADGNLVDQEILFLRTWLSEYEEVKAEWPGSAIGALVETVLADGAITEDERRHLLTQLEAICGSDFTETGSTSPTVAALPLDTEPLGSIDGQGVCHTGEFLYGTRSACERLTAAAGGLSTGTVTKKTDLLVVGTNVSPHWANTSYGRKIEQAMHLKKSGHHIRIVSEENWFQACIK